MSSSVTFDDVTNAYLAQGRDTVPPPQTHVLRMMSALGDLATVFSSPQYAPSSFEQQEIRSLVGEVALSVCALGASLNVDVGAATVAAARKRGAAPAVSKRETLRPQDPHFPASSSAVAQQQQQAPNNGKPRPPPLATPDQPLAAARPADGGSEPMMARSGRRDSDAEERKAWGHTLPGQEDPGLVSPRTTAAFFPELDRVVEKYRSGRLSRNDFNALRLTWSVIEDNGEVVDLLPSGRYKLVAFEDFMAYVKNAEHLRHHSDKPQGFARPTPIRPVQVEQDDGSSSRGLMSPGLQATQPAPGYEVHRFELDQPRAVHGHFSPDHFKGGLFSPQTSARYVDVEYPAEQVAAQQAAQQDVSPPRLAGPAMGARDVNGKPLLAQAPQGGGSGHNGSATPTTIAASPTTNHSGQAVDPKDEATFWQKVAIIKSREATGNAVAALDLTLTMPLEGKWVPLTTNGEYLPVTSSNVDDFLSLIQEQKQMRSGQLRRRDTMRALTVPDVPNLDPKDEARKFGHDRYDNTSGQMLAPAPPTRNVHYVDYAEGAVSEVLPPALQRKALPRSLPSVAHFLDFIMSHPESFRDIFNASGRDPGVLSRLQVTYCVPDPDALLSPHQVASLPPGTRPRSAVRDLVQNGRQIRVQPQDYQRYRDMVLEASRSLPASVAVQP